MGDEYLILSENRVRPTTLFLAWQDKRERRWFPVGRLDADGGRSQYVFRYTHGAGIAKRDSGFAPLYDFPRLEDVYESRRLFPLFENRVMNRGRRSFRDYLELLAIENPDPDPLEILAIDGGRRVTDNFEVFPKIEKSDDGEFRCRFLLHGSGHVSRPARERLLRLAEGERLHVALELTNPAMPLAVQLQTEDYHMIGWAPRYLVADLAEAMAHAPTEYKANVVRTSTEALFKHSVLIELSGCWPEEHEPMSSESYQLLGGDEEDALPWT